MGKRFALLLLIVLVIIGAVIVYFILPEREPDVFTLVPPWEAEVKEVFWIDNDTILITQFSREGEGDIESRIFKFNPFTEAATEIFRTSGWRLDLSVLDFSLEKDLLAIKEGDQIKVINFSGETVFQIEEAGTNTQALFSPNQEKMAFTTFAEWELPTNLFILDLETQEKQQVTDYEFGQSYKTGGIAWCQENDLYFVEEFAFGTLTIGGQRIFSAQPEREQELFWEVSDKEQIIGFHFLNSEQLLSFFVEWDDDAMETQLFLGHFNVSQDQKKWVVPLDRMGDQELWKEKKTGYPTRVEMVEELILVTEIDEDGKFNMLALNLETGEKENEIEKTGFPRISPDNEWIVFSDFSGDEPLIKVGPLTNYVELR